MPRIAKTDLDEIFGDTEVADTVTIAGNTATGHFYEPTENAMDIEGTNPTFICEQATATAAGAARGAALVHNSISYTIQRIINLNAGAVRLVLSKN